MFQLRGFEVWGSGVGSNLDPSSEDGRLHWLELPNHQIAIRQIAISQLEPPTLTPIHEHGGYGFKILREWMTPGFEGFHPGEYS